MQNQTQIVLSNTKGALIFSKLPYGEAKEFFNTYGIENIYLHQFNRYISHCAIETYFKDVLEATQFLNDKGIDKSILDNYQIID